jgi:hypothetical protein
MFRKDTLHKQIDERINREIYDLTEDKSSYLDRALKLVTKNNEKKSCRLFLANKDGTISLNEGIWTDILSGKLLHPNDFGTNNQVILPLPKSDAEKFVDKYNFIMQIKKIREDNSFISKEEIDSLLKRFPKAKDSAQSPMSVLRNMLIEEYNQMGSELKTMNAKL